MTNTNYTVLIQQLKTVSNEPSDSGNRRGYRQAIAFIMDSDLSGEQKELVRAELYKSADTNQGYHYNSNGVHGALETIKTLYAANDDSITPLPPTPITASELIAKVEGGKIFGVSFIKRTTGELRTMTARLGVKKFLRGGKLAFSQPKSNYSPSLIWPLRVIDRSRLKAFFKLGSAVSALRSPQRLNKLID